MARRSRAWCTELVLVAAILTVVSEPTPVHSREIPRRRGGKTADVTSMVRVPGRPTALRVFTADEEDNAREYAKTEGGEYVPLPVADPVWDWSTHQFSKPTA